MNKLLNCMYREVNFVVHEFVISTFILLLGMAFPTIDKLIPCVVVKGSSYVAQHLSSGLIEILYTGL